ncbi:hypothetical protein KBY27_22710 [Ruegeria pomeroyi]|uniref:Uncharacterized protein n=1 Tax=Ruegeria pomeroyi TaxID=89184 RepID=A0A9Q3ZPL6_9RHOB|nr:hypothetical protein [Ruegeria pomeroyi]MCE8540285.1 hypothetical protein [Ruegeria pomeroyi]
MNHAHYRRIHKETQRWAEEIARRSTYFITLNPHRTASFNRGSPNTRGTDAYALLRRWDAKMNHALLGPRWAAKKEHLHTRWIAFPEGFRENRHWHLLFDLSPDLPSSAVEDAANRLRLPSTGLTVALSSLVNHHWKNVAPSGTGHTLLIGSPEIIAKYGTKEQFLEERQTGFMTSRELKH